MIFLPIEKTCVWGAQKNRLDETVPFITTTMFGLDETKLFILFCMYANE